MSKDKVTKTPADISAKWGRNLKNAIPDVVAGVNRVSESPMEKAISKKDKMRANIVKSIDDGKWEAGLRGVSLETWKAKTAKKVQERMSGGVDAGMSKREAFDRSNVETINEILPTIAAMPDMTIQDSVARVAAFMEHMHSKPYRRA